MQRPLETALFASVAYSRLTSSMLMLLIGPNDKRRFLFWEVDVIDLDSQDIDACALAKVSNKSFAMLSAQ